jgi:Domain of unknown function (DUF6379)
MSAPLNVIEDDSLRATDSGFELRLRFKWYRSLPLSCVENLQLSVDGRPLDPAVMRFGVNGHTFRLEELADQVEESWFIIDSAVLSVEQPGVIKPGEEHLIDVAFGMRAPYIPIGPGKFLTIINRQSTTQVAA